jgi:hypothetical protein
VTAIATAENVLYISRIKLLSVYLPYLIVPLWIVAYFAARPRPFAVAESAAPIKSKSKPKRT